MLPYILDRSLLLEGQHHANDVVPMLGRIRNFFEERLAPERADSTDYFQFTSLINRAYTSEQKIHLVELLWRIAYANESLHIFEEHLVRKVADLLYVPHSAFIAPKHKVRRER